MNMEIIASAASNALANIVLAVIALAGGYAVYYIRLAGAQVKAQTKQIEDAVLKVKRDAPYLTVSEALLNGIDETTVKEDVSGASAE